MTSEDRLDPEIGGHQFHTQDGTQVHDGSRHTCPRCTPPGATEDQEWAAARERIRVQHERLDEEAGWVPLLDAIAPDFVSRLTGALSGVEALVTMASQRIETLDQVVQRVAGRPTHERELLRRAAALIDPDLVETMTYEQRMDWLAKYREVTS